MSRKTIFKIRNGRRFSALSVFKSLAVAVWVAGLLQCAAPPPAGAVMTDSNLFAALNLNYPGLDQVRTNVLQNNYVAAVTNLATYLRTRTNVNWYFDPHAVTNTIGYNKTSADQTTNGYVNSIGIGYTFPNAVINWFYNVTTNPANGYAPNNEWQWQMNRMGFWPGLGDTWWGTGNDAYTKFWVGQLRSWLTNCPVPASRQNVAGSCWRTIESGIRMGTSWPNTYHRFLLAPSFTDQDVCDYLKCCIDHSRYLSNYYTSGNFLTMEMSGLYTVGALYPELTNAASWRNFAAQTLYSEETNQFYPDGVQKEMSTGYHGVALGNILTIYNVAALEGLVPELPTNYVPNLEKGYAHYLQLMAPDRTMPQFNDCISAPNSMGSLAAVTNLFTNRLDFLWVASDGASGVPPSFTSYNYPWAGYNVMRSGWSRTDNYLCLDGGAMGAAHQHQDKLNVVLWANGRKILYDSGGGNYETSIWRSYAISTYAHNTVIVDGLPQAGGDGTVSYSDPDYVAQAPIDSRWETDPNHDFAAGIYTNGYGTYTSRPARQTRRILFIKPDLYLVADTLAPTDAASHTYEARWNLIPTNTVMDAVTKSVTTADAGLANLAVVPCLLSNLTVASVVARSNASYNLLLGWNITGSQSGPIPATTVTHTRSGTGTNQFLTLFMPLAAGVANPVTNVVATGSTSSRLELSDGRRMLVYTDPDPTHGLRLIELLADGTTNRIAGGGFTPPVISDIADQVTSPGTPVGPVAFTVGETNYFASNLIVFAQSLSPAIVANSGIVLGGSGTNRTVTITPSAIRAGTATIQLTVIDTNGATDSIRFNVNVVVPPAVNYHWDTAINAGLQAAGGIWSGTNANWSSTNTGSNPLLTWPATGNDASFFGAGGTCAITVSATQNVNNLLLTNGTFIIGGGALNHFVGPATVTVYSNAVLNLPFVGDTDFIKLGSGTLTLGAPATYSSNTFVKLGTLQLSTNDVLPASSEVTLGATNGTAGNLYVNGNQTVASLNFQSLGVATNYVSIAAGKTLAISNATADIAFGVGNYLNTIGGIVATTRVSFASGGALAVTAPNGLFAIEPCGTNSSGIAVASLDLSGLASLTASVNKFNAAVIGGNPVNSGLQFVLSLATNNTITANNNIVLGSSGVGNSGSVTNTISLGQSNVFNAGGIVVFGGRQAGSMSFRTGASSNLTLRGVAGGVSRANLWIGDQYNLSGIGNGGGGSTTCGSLLNCGVGTVDARLNQLTLGIGGSSAGGYGPAAGTFIFGGTNSVIDANSIILGYAVSNSAWGSSSTNPATHVGTVSMGGGTLNVNSNFFLGYSADDDLGNIQNVTGVFNFSGGNANVTSNVFLGYAANTVGVVSGTLNLTNGILNVGGDILSSGITATGTVNLVGATLNLNRNDIGSAAKSINLIASSGTLANVGELNGGGPLVKTGSGTLTLFGTNSYTGNTAISAGKLVGLTGGSCSNSAFTVQSGATNGVLALAGGGQWFCGALTTGAGSYLELNFTNSTISNAAAPLKVLGNFSYTNPTVIVRTATSIINGQYPLIEFTSLSGTVISNVTFVPALSSKLKYSLITNAAQSTLDLMILNTNITGTLSWAVGSGNWDFATMNWKDIPAAGSANKLYQDAWPVVLDDSASGAGAILVTNTAPVSPFNVVVDASAKNYTIFGSAITGGAPLTKNGSGTLTFAGTNTYAGNTTVNAGLLVVGGGGAIISPNASLNIGPGATAATNTLAAGGTIVVKTLLATNVVCGGVSNSTFNFSGGTLTTSNSNGLASSILLASNVSLNMNSSWNLNGGAAVFSNVATNQNASAFLFVGNGTSGVQVNVNPGATWWHAIPAGSRSTNTLALTVGFGNATNNVFAVSGGTLLITNAAGNSPPVSIGSSAGSVGNQMRILNGGQALTRNSFPLNQGGSVGLNLGGSGANNSLVVAGTNAAGLPALWDFNKDRLYIGATLAASNCWARVDSGGVITNTSLFMFSMGGSLFVTNGGQVYSSGLSLGRGGVNNTIGVGGLDGGGSPSLLSFYSGTVVVGGGSVSSSTPGTNNTLWVDAGGLMTNVGALYVGGGASVFDSNCIGNRVTITNGGQAFNLAVNIGNQSGCNSNSVNVGGGVGLSLWNLGGNNLVIGSHAFAANNSATLLGGGVLTNVSSVILGGVNSLVNFNGGTLAAGTGGNWLNTNSTTLNGAVYVQYGGAILDSVGFTVTNLLPLLQDPASPGGGLTKLGSGTLTLLGANTYSGYTAVNAGTLLVNGDSSGATNAVTVAGGAGFGGLGTVGGGVIVNSGGLLVPGGTDSVGQLTLANRLTLNGGGLFYKLANNGGTNDQISVGDVLTVNGVNMVYLTGAAPVGTNTLMTFGSLSGSGTFVLEVATPDIFLLTNGNSLQLAVTKAFSAGLIWKGYQTGVWDDAANKNWLSGAAVNFTPGDTVVFDDTLVANSTVSSGGTVLPGMVSFNNSLTNYVVSAVIGGTGAVTKSGSATVTLSGVNIFSGGVTLEAGTLVAGNAGALGTGLLELNGGTLSNSVSLALTNGVNLSGAAGLGVGNGMTNSITGALTNVGSLNLMGPGTVILGGNNSFSGGLTMSGGTNNLNSTTALGTGV
ncbi:MAG: heparinase II/III family protein, partial [Verrucomicrobiota bacterium]